MTHISWVNRSIFLATAGGTASFSVSAAVTGYMTPASAGTVDGEEYHYAAETTNGSGSINQWEVGTGVYTATAGTLARTPLFSSTTANAVVNFATAPYVMLTALAEDFEVELDADTTFHVATTGSDTTGLGTAALPWATLQHAKNYLDSIELQGFTATIQIADGTYSGVNMPRPSSSGIVAYKGNAGDNTLVVITPNLFGFNCFGITAPNLVQVFDLTINPGGTSTHTGIFASGPAIDVYCSNVSFIGGGGLCFWGTNGPFFNVTGNWSIAGNWISAIRLDTAQMEIDSSALTLVTTPAFSETFIKVTDQGLYHTFNSPMTFAGTATGKKFIVEDGGVIQTTTNDLTYFPGDVVGEIQAGGQYDDFGPRRKLIANQVYYIATTGNDANVGSAGSPWLTLQHAMNVISNTLDLSIYKVTVNIGAGTFAGLGLIDVIGGRGVEFIGAGSGSTTIVDGPNDGVYNFGECVDYPYGMGAFRFYFNKVTFQNHGVGNCTIVTLWQRGDIILGQEINFTVTQDVVFDLTYMNGGTSYNGQGGGPTCFDIQGNGEISIWPATYIGGGATIESVFLSEGAFGTLMSTSAGNTKSGDFTLTGPFIKAINYNQVNMGTQSATFFSSGSGTITGKRFQINSGAAVYSFGGPGVLGPNFYPGTVAGTVDDFVSSYDGFLGGGNINTGFTVTPGDGGTKSSGTFTPAAANGNYQYYINGGAHAFGLPAADSAIDVLITNNGSAGAITFDAGYAGGTHGDSLTTTDTQKFIVSVRRINSVSAYIIKALQ